MRGFLGLVAGIIVGLLVQALIVFAASFAIEIPAVGSMARADFAQAFAESGAPALLVGIFSYFLGALAAAWTAGAIAGRDWAAWTAGGAIALLTLTIAIMFPDPAWAQFGAFGGALLGTVVGKHLGARREADTGTDEGIDGPADAAI